MVHDTVRPLFLLWPVARTIPSLRGHSLVFPCFPHHSYFNVRSAFPFSFSPLPIYSDKNPRHKRELKLPRMMIHNTIPTKKSKGHAPAANGNRTVPPPLPARQHQSPPPVPTKETMSGADSSLAMSLNTAYYNPYGHHSSKSNKTPARSPSGVGTQVEKTCSTCSQLVG
jgi:hypothetical protein